MPKVRPEGDEEEKLRSLVMTEVSKQLNPILAVVQAVHEWQLSFWSNGSGKPPGFFQTRIKSDDERYKQLIDEVGKLTDHKEAMDAFIIELRLSRAMRERREEEAKERRKFWLGLLWKIGGPVATGLLGLLSWGVAKAVPIGSALWNDYLHTHPAVVEQINTNK